MQKNNESTLQTTLTFQVILTLLVWLALLGYAGFQLYQLRLLPTLAPTATTITIPSLNQAELSTLETSLKATESIALPITRPEPFD